MTTAKQQRVAPTIDFRSLVALAAEYVSAHRLVIIEAGSPKAAVRCRMVAEKIMGDVAGAALSIRASKPPIVAKARKRRVAAAFTWGNDGKAK